MKQFKITKITLLLTTIFYLLSGVANALTYSQVTDLKNPYDTVEASTEKKEILRQAKSKQFDLCVSDTTSAVGFVYAADKQYPLESKDEIFKINAETLGSDYPFASNEQNPHALVTKLALDTGWQYKGQSRDKVAAQFWD